MATAVIVSATAAAISAAFAGLTSVAAWTTIRSRRPRLTVVCAVGREGENGNMVLDEHGTDIAVRAANVRDTDVQVVDLWFQAEVPRVVLRWPPFSKPKAGIVWPSTSSFLHAPGADLVPGTVPAHHTAMYTFRMEDVGLDLVRAGHGKYRVIVECTGGQEFRSAPIDVALVPLEAEA